MSSSEDVGKKKITLKSSDGEEFEVEISVAMESQTIRHMIEDDCAESGIPLPNVTSKILAKVIEYCRKHVLVEQQGAAKSSSDGGSGGDKTPTDEEDLKAWDADFVKVDQPTLFDLILDRRFQPIVEPDIFPDCIHPIERIEVAANL